MDNIDLAKVEDFEMYGHLVADKLCDPNYLPINVEYFIETLLAKLNTKLDSDNYSKI